MNITVLQNHLSGVVRASIPVARATSFYAAKATLYGVILFGIILEATANKQVLFSPALRSPEGIGDPCQVDRGINAVMS